VNQNPRWQPQVIDGGRSDNVADAQLDPVELRLSIDEDAEAAVVASLLHDESLLDSVRSWLREEHFYSEAHRRMYAAICQVRDAGKPIDIVSMATQLKDTDRLGNAGGMPYITIVQNAAPALGESRLKAYATSVRDKWIRRRTRMVGERAMLQAISEPSPIERIIDNARAELDQLTLELEQADKDTSVQDILKRTLLRMSAMKQTNGKGAIPTGFDRLDTLIGGLPQTLFILAARPGMGKTSLATRIAVNVASRKDDMGELRNGVYFASMETLDEEAMMRLWCAEARVSVTRSRTGMLTPEDWQRLSATAAFINSLPMRIDDSCAQTVSQLWGHCRRANMSLQRAGKRLRLVVVDYLQLLKAPRAGMSREEIVSENTRQLVAMSGDLKCCVLALAQLNRNCESRNDKRPQLADLRESGEIEQAARVIAFIYRDDYYNKNSSDRNIAEVIVAKQNNGPTDTVKLRFDGEYTRFDNLAEHEYDEWEQQSELPKAAVPIAKRQPEAVKAQEPPPGFYDDAPEPVAAQVDLIPGDPKTEPKRKRAARPATKAMPPRPTLIDPQEMLARRAVTIVVEAIEPGMTIDALYRKLGDANGMAVNDTEAFLDRAEKEGRVIVTGKGADRVLRRS
jgi:replicative DNA helicase